MSLSKVEQETVTRLVSEGLSHSSDLLASMSRSSWQVVSSQVEEMSISAILPIFNKDKTTYVAALFHAFSTLPLEVLVLFTPESGQAVAEAVMRPYLDRMRETLDMVQSTIGEVSNILSQGAVKNLADAFNISVILSSPGMMVGTKANLLSTALEEYSTKKDAVLIWQVELSSKALSAQCSIILAVNTESVHRLFEAAKS